MGCLGGSSEVASVRAGVARMGRGCVISIEGRATGKRIRVKRRMEGTVRVSLVQCIGERSALCFRFDWCSYGRQDV